MKRTIPLLERLERENPDLLNELVDYVSSIAEEEAGVEVKSLDDVKALAARRPRLVAEAMADFLYLRVVRPLVESVMNLVSAGAPGLEYYSPSAIEGLPKEVRVKVRVLRTVVNDFKKLLEQLGIEPDRYELPEV